MSASVSLSISSIAMLHALSMASLLTLRNDILLVLRLRVKHPLEDIVAGAGRILGAPVRLDILILLLG